jgi:prepilin signal peptidase PulO-like enzyme (type II secretory pathway)
MINETIVSLLGGLVFAGAGYLGVLFGTSFAERLPRFEDGPREVEPPVEWLIAGCAIVGALVVTHAKEQVQIALIALVCAALVAVFVTDARRGIVPDLFTLGPLAILLAIGLWQHQWLLPVSAAVAFVPFAMAALLSRGRGMGWGDVKLAALGGAMLGAQLSVLAFAAACFAAVAVNYSLRRDRRAIAFAPYLATAIGVTIPLAVWR